MPRLEATTAFKAQGKFPMGLNFLQAQNSESDGTAQEQHSSVFPPTGQHTVGRCNLSNSPGPWDVWYISVNPPAQVQPCCNLQRVCGWRHLWFSLSSMMGSSGKPLPQKATSPAGSGAAAHVDSTVLVRLEAPILLPPYAPASYHNCSTSTEPQWYMVQHPIGR